MKSLSKSFLVLFVMCTMAEAAFAQVPFTNDRSDGNNNTGMGSGALGGPAASSGGSYNTASGFYALHASEIANGNSVFGYIAQ
jgi:hypothetical protein